MNFNVLCRDYFFDYKNDMKKYSDREIELEDIPVFDIDFSDIKFDKIDELEEFLEEHKDDTELRTAVDRWNVIQFIG